MMMQVEYFQKNNEKGLENEKCPNFSHHPTIGDIISKRYLQLMFKIPKMGLLPTAVPCPKSVNHQRDLFDHIPHCDILLFAPSSCWHEQKAGTASAQHLPSKNMAVKPTSMGCNRCISMYVYARYKYRYVCI